jgi:hypothetical protein
MKGLVFNLLESLARDAGCSEEAWEVVAEFAATEVLLEGSGSRPTSDVQPTSLFEVPAEAMVKCFARKGESGDDDERGPDLIDMEDRAEWLGTFDLPDLMPSYFDALPREPQLGVRAFSDYDGFDSDAWRDDDDD